MIHTIYIPPSAEGGVDAMAEAIAIPEGKAPWALIAPPLWLAWHKLWWALVVYLLVTAIALSLLATPAAPVTLLLGGLPGLYLLLEGHQLRRNKLERMGWRFVGVAEGHDEHEAIARHAGHMVGMAQRSLIGAAA
ncbi:MAG: DUF2628 domain-containing protein [Pseudomonadota bacterium]